MSEPPERAEGEHFRDLDWYAEDLAAAQYVGCTFTDVDPSST